LVTSLDCSSDADCCVVGNQCGTALTLVTRAEQSALAACLSSLSVTMCPPCVTPAVQVSCQNGACTGTVVGYAWPPAGLSASHCGILPVGGSGGSGATGGATLRVTSLPALDGLSAAVVFNCG
jgi:hypothetical protein